MPQTTKQEINEFLKKQDPATHPHARNINLRTYRLVKEVAPTIATQLVTQTQSQDQSNNLLNLMSEKELRQYVEATTQLDKAQLKLISDKAQLAVDAALGSGMTFAEARRHKLLIRNRERQLLLIELRRQKLAQYGVIVRVNTKRRF